MAQKKPALSKKFTRSQVKWRTFLSFALLTISLLVVAPTMANKAIDWVNNSANLGLPRFPEAGFNLGLDLQGGAHLIYQADTTQMEDADRADSVEGVRDIIERRVRGGLGVSEPLVQTTKVGEDYRIIIELPGITDVNQAIGMIGETPVLEFKEENNEPPRELTEEEQKELENYNSEAKNKVDQALSKLRQDVVFEEVVQEYSEDEVSKAVGGNLGFITSDIYPEIHNWAKLHVDGDISKDAVKSFEGLNILKRIGERDGEKMVTASHLLVCYEGSQMCPNAEYSKENAFAKIQELKASATPENFEQLVKENSTEPGAAELAGDLGTFGKGAMVPAFEAVVWDQVVGTISDVVETDFGYHLIYKKFEENTKEYEIARIFIDTKSETDIVPPTNEWKATELSGKYLKRAEVTQDQRTGQIQVSLQFDNEGTDLFAEITERNVKKLVAIFLDGSPISTPRVSEPIYSGDAVITGGFNLSEAKLLSQRLNSGALPVPIELISQQKVDATLGASSLQKSLRAAMVGFVLVMLFMLLYYRLPGLVSVVSLIIYGALTLAIFKIIGVTLTLSGIAGFILSLGMAVDANVLIFERLKEELKSGKTLKSSVEEAFIRAWTSIRDGNITTLISCIFLIWFGSGFVQGFAVTLALGVLVSMFTAVVITRAMMRLMVVWFKEKGNVLFIGYKKD